MRLLPLCRSAAFAALFAAFPLAAQSAWRPLRPDTIGRMLVVVELSADTLVRISIDTVGSKTLVRTAPVRADSVALWVSAVNRAMLDSAGKGGAEIRLESSVLATPDTSTLGPAFRLVVDDSTGDRTFAVLVPYTHMGRVAAAFGRRNDDPPAVPNTPDSASPTPGTVPPDSKK